MQKLRYVVWDVTAVVGNLGVSAATARKRGQRVMARFCGKMGFVKSIASLLPMVLMLMCLVLIDSYACLLFLASMLHQVIAFSDEQLNALSSLKRFTMKALLLHDIVFCRCVGGA